MSRYRGPRLRIIRRLGELPGLTRKKAKRVERPGQHGKQQRKASDYAIRLEEKQKLRYNYGINEKQLIRYVKRARRLKGPTGEILLEILENRLDNIIFRLGFAPTIPAARQLVTHKHFLVNGKSLNIPSYECQFNDTITVQKPFGLYNSSSAEYQISAVDPSNYSIEYPKFRTYLTSSIDFKSFAEITAHTMRTFSGDVFRIAGYVKDNGPVGNWIKIADTPIESPELLV